MQLFYAPNITLPVYALPEEESGHCVRVLRYKPGDVMHLTDGRGNLYEAEVEEASPKKCTVRVIRTIPEFEKRPYRLIMAVAPTKNIDRFEWFLEKATETGTDRFIPVVSRRSERRSVKPERLLRVVTSAVKQSLKAYHPQLDDVIPFEELVAKPLIMEDGTPFAGTKLIAHCNPTEREFIGSCLHPGEDILVLIGPEGDFSPEEVKFAEAHGFHPVSLGSSRLRTETAAVAAAMFVSFVNGK